MRGELAHRRASFENPPPFHSSKNKAQLHVVWCCWLHKKKQTDILPSPHTPMLQISSHLARCFCMHLFFGGHRPRNLRGRTLSCATVSSIKGQLRLAKLLVSFLAMLFKSNGHSAFQVTKTVQGLCTGKYLPINFCIFKSALLCEAQQSHWPSLAKQAVEQLEAGAAHISHTSLQLTLTGLGIILRFLLFKTFVKLALGIFNSPVKNTCK